MGVLNVTPDSFSDGGLFMDADRAAAHAVAMTAAGADIIDVGGESSRPGAGAVTGDEERRRVIPVVRRLCRDQDVVVSVDTTKRDIAAAALDVGACIINDISALTFDPGMANLVASSKVGVVLMHRQGNALTMQDNPRYVDVVGDVRAWLAARLAAAEQAGVAREAIVIDPGIGFGKTVEHNLALLASLPALATLGVPLLVGLSRKRFIGTLTGAETTERLPGSLAGAVCARLGGAAVLRVHDVAETRQALTVADAIRAAKAGSL